VACHEGPVCGRHANARPGEISRRFGVPVQLELSARYTIAPSQLAPILDQTERLALTRWGPIPSWAKDPSVGARMINARAETVAEKPAFRRPLRAQRCLVPASGFLRVAAGIHGQGPVLFGHWVVMERKTGLRDDIS